MNKYQDALNYLRNSALVADHKQKDIVNQCTELLQNLIHEYFDNPPLSFEEMKEGDWIWDNLHKTYIHIFAFDIVSPSVKIIQTDDDYTPFELNRFYRKQVKE